MKLENKLEEYYDKFGKHFPLMPTTALTSKEIIEKIDECIKKNEIYDPQLRKGVVY